MRFGRLDLLRYGKFTNLSLSFPVRTPDIHIVFGPNEAGKSTALSALEDLLFGIPDRSPLNFLHDYASLRLGALLENDGDRLEIHRRKGRNDTLLTRDEVPLTMGEAVLAPYRGGADLAFFTRMFNLDSNRLREGGKEILEAKDEVGQMLFSAGSGLIGFAETLQALEKEADGLWSTRRAERRVYFQADDRRKAAEEILRSHILTPTKWQEAKNLYEEARDAYGAIDKKIEHKTTEKKKLDRIRRSYRNVRKLEEIERDLSVLGNVPLLPEGAHNSLLTAEREEEKALAQVRILSEQIEVARGELSSLKLDTTLVLHEEDIKKLNAGRTRVRDGKADLPKREAELASAEGQFLLLASELGWKGQEVQDLIGKLPPRTKTAEVRRFLTNRGAIFSEVDAARQSLGEAEDKVADLSRSLESLGTPASLSTLAAIAKNARSQGDLASQIRLTRDEIHAAQRTMERLAASIVPSPDVEILPGCTLPSHDTVQEHRDRLKDLGKNRQVIQERIRSGKHELDRLRKAYGRLVLDEEGIAPDSLEKVRQNREAGWSIIRRKYIEALPVPEEEVRSYIKEKETLAGAYETAVILADSLADLRVEKADAAANLTIMARQIQDKEEILQELENEKSALDQDTQSFDEAWKSLWSGLPSESSSPDTMLEWLNIRMEWQEFLERKEGGKRKLDVLSRQEEEIRQSILDGLTTAGFIISDLSTMPLSIVLGRVEETLSMNDRLLDQKKNLENEILQAKNNVSRKKTTLDKVKKTRLDWEKEWSTTIGNLGLDPVASPESVEGQIEAIEEMRTIIVKINNLRHERIGKIQRDCQAFEQEVANILPVLAPDLTSTDAEEAVLQLERRLDEAKRMNDLKKEKDSTILTFEQKIGSFETSLNAARETISNLKTLAGVKEIPELKAIIEKTDQVRFLEKEKVQILRVLNEEGDGLSLPDILAECAGGDLDQISAREGTVTQDLEDLHQKRLAARDHRTETQRAVESVGGDDIASRAEAMRQEALSEMQEIADRYTHVRSSAILLRWAIDRYRREKQAPLLKTASGLFSLLTGGSFSALRIDYDDQDQPQLVGVRMDGSTVKVPGLSTGTADQLYLALRIASVLDYLDRAPSLPFVTDDLFINFDDERAFAGFKVLSQLAEKTQVIFFTHHRHLVEIGKKSLGSSLSLISLQT